MLEWESHILEGIWHQIERRSWGIYGRRFLISVPVWTFLDEKVIFVYHIVINNIKLETKLLMGGTFSGESSTPIQAAAGKFGLGHDLDEAVIAATNHQIDQEGQLVTTVTLSVGCDNLPNLDTFSKSDAMCVLYQF